MTRKDAWEDWELQVLYDHCNDLDWYDFAREQLRNRSENAIRTKMSLLRSEAGIIPRQHGPKAKSRWAVTRDGAKDGSDALLNALMGMVA